MGGSPAAGAVEAVVDRHAVTLVERRAPWRHEYGPEWTSSPVARLRWSVSRREWTLYWRDRNHSWHRYDYSTPTTANARGAYLPRHSSTIRVSGCSVV